MAWVLLFKERTETAAGFSLGQYHQILVLSEILDMDKQVALSAGMGSVEIAIKKRLWQKVSKVIIFSNEHAFRTELCILNSLR